jgi:DNA-binding protein H-NS
VSKTATTTKARRVELEAELLKTMDRLDSLKVELREAQAENREQVKLHQEKLREIRDILSGRELEQTRIPGTETGPVKPPKLPKKSARPAAPSPRGVITRWAADARAKRPPKFVVEATGLETKKAIVAKYGPGACFEMGKPIPRPAASKPAAAKRKPARCSKCDKPENRPGGALTTAGVCWDCHTGKAEAPRASAAEIAKETCLDCGVPAGELSPSCDACDHGRTKSRPPDRATKKFPKGAKDLAEVCTKCERPLGEHAGTRCPPTVAAQVASAVEHLGIKSDETAEARP